MGRKAEDLRAGAPLWCGPVRTTRKGLWQGGAGGAEIRPLVIRARDATGQAVASYDTEH